MDRYAKENAANRIDGYYDPTPQESAAGQYQQAFERAKAETVKNLRLALEQTESLSVADFFACTKRSVLLAYVRCELNGNIGKHDWAVGEKCGSGYLVFVDDRPVSYRPTPLAAKALALEMIERLQADGDYRLNDKPAGFSPPPLQAPTAEQERLEQLQALGFANETEYVEHQALLARVEEMGKSHSVLVADGEWCLLQRAH